MNALFEMWQTMPLAFVVSAGLLGLVVGSFLNVLIYRLPIMMAREWQQQCAEINQQVLPVQAPFNLFVPRSACPHCQRPITALENIPLLSYLFLRGKCAGCGGRISLRYPLVELLSAVLTAAAAGYFGFGLTALVAMIFIWLMITLTFIDFDTQLLPDSLTLSLLWLGLLLNINSLFTPLVDAVLGAMFGYVLLWSVYWAFKLTTGKEGMGYGDFKLLAALGAWFGWQLLPLIIMLSSVVGAVVGIVLIVAFKQGRNTPIPFGPYLACGGLIALFWGQALTQQYLQFWFV